MGRNAKYSVSAACFLFAAFLCLFPGEMILSVKEGLLLWYSQVLPSVFPFLIVIGVLIEIGAIGRIGRLLEPVMRPVFGIPGAGAFALIMGGVSGYPVGAKITADLREKKLITRGEAQRLMSFSNNPSPLFMLGAVGTSILGSVTAGYFIAFSNYLSALLVGLIFRFYEPEDGIRQEKHTAADGYGVRGGRKPLGMVLGDSVMYAVNTVVQIGGFILLFSALISMLKISHVLPLIAKVLAPVSMLGVDARLLEPFAAGTLEITNGIKMAGETTAAFSQKVILSGILVSFGGLSIFAQSASIFSKTDISAGVYLLSKILHGILTGLIMYLVYPAFMGQYIPAR